MIFCKVEKQSAVSGKTEITVFVLSAFWEDLSLFLYLKVMGNRIKQFC